MTAIASQTPLEETREELLSFLDEELASFVNESIFQKEGRKLRFADELGKPLTHVRLISPRPPKTVSMTPGPAYLPMQPIPLMTGPDSRFSTLRGDADFIHMRSRPIFDDREAMPLRNITNDGLAGGHRMMLMPMEGMHSQQHPHMFASHGPPPQDRRAYGQAPQYGSLRPAHYIAYGGAPPSMPSVHPGVAHQKQVSEQENKRAFDDGSAGKAASAPPSGHPGRQSAGPPPQMMAPYSSLPRHAMPGPVMRDGSSGSQPPRMVPIEYAGPPPQMQRSMRVAEVPSASRSHLGEYRGEQDVRVAPGFYNPYMTMSAPNARSRMAYN